MNNQNSQYAMNWKFGNYQTQLPQDQRPQQKGCVNSVNNTGLNGNTNSGSINNCDHVSEKSVTTQSMESNSKTDQKEPDKGKDNISDEIAFKVSTLLTDNILQNAISNLSSQLIASPAVSVNASAPVPAEWSVKGPTKKRIGEADVTNLYDSLTESGSSDDETANTTAVESSVPFRYVIMFMNL